MSDKIAKDRSERIENKERKRAESDAPKSTLFVHNVATILTTLADKLGLPVKATEPKKVIGLSYNPASDSDGSTQLPVSPFLTQRSQERSDIVAGIDTEGEESRDRAFNPGKMLPILKAKMGWYKVPCQSFDYGPAILDTLLYERGIKGTAGSKGRHSYAGQTVA